MAFRFDDVFDSVLLEFKDNDRDYGRGGRIGAGLG